MPQTFQNCSHQIPLGDQGAHRLVQSLCTEQAHLLLWSQKPGDIPAQAPQRKDSLLLERASYRGPDLWDSEHTGLSDFHLFHFMAYINEFLKF